MFREAQWLAAKLDEEFRGIVAIVTGNKQTGDVQRIAREYLKRKLEHDMEQRTSAARIGVYSRSGEPGRIVVDDLAWIDS